MSSASSASQQQQQPSRRSRKRAKTDICRLLKSTTSDGNNNAVYETVQNADVQQPLNLCVRDDVRDADATEADADADVLPLTSASAPPLQKRRKKRSAIFVPPEKLANEVCICKFKFVAGHQPKLEEKKVLSIDAGGNFKFFPELHKPPDATLAVDAAAALVNHSNKPVPDLIPIDTLLPGTSTPTSTPTPTPPLLSPPPPPPLPPLPPPTVVRKLSRRQKLEQTFREKGFLIQTQHVQATEGSVFCKFRQLKKFTRYLYRSWRNYLPEDRVGDPTAAPSAGSDPVDSL